MSARKDGKRDIFNFEVDCHRDVQTAGSLLNIKKLIHLLHRSSISEQELMSVGLTYIHTCRSYVHTSRDFTNSASQT